MAVDVAHPETTPPAQPAVLSRPESSIRAEARSGAPLLEPAQGGLAERFADAVGPHPVRAFLAAAVGGYVLLVALTTALGFLLTRVLLDIDGLASFDARVSDWLARERTSTLVDLSWLGSTLAGGLVIPVVVGVLLFAFLLSRHWRLAAFTLFVICIESGTYRATSLVIHRDRPDVERLEGLPVDQSFPSGHTAASVALFGGLLLVLASRLESRLLRALLYALVVAIPLFVLWSRMERGMHNPTDVAAGLLMGTGAIIVAVFAARAAGAAADRKDRLEQPS